MGDALPGLFEMSRLETAAQECHQLVLAARLMTEPARRQQALAALAREKAHVAETAQRYEATITAESDRKQLETLLAQVREYDAAADEWLAVPAGADDLRARTAVEHTHEVLMDALGRLTSANEAHGREAAGRIVSSVEGARRAMWVGIGIALLLAITSGLSLVHSITKPLGQVVEALDVIRGGDFSRKLALARKDEFGIVADGFDRMSTDLTSLIGQVQKYGLQVGTSENDIAATSRQQQATANEMAATIGEIGATASEISATSRELARTMKDVMAAADSTASMAADGQKDLGRMEATMRQIAEASSSINNKLSVLNDKAANIGSVVVTITKVADQTNLLSLNAAIEAEKAGESGRGFAVVATEIRRLADQTAVATYDIEQIVKEIQSAVSAGVMGMDKFSEEVRRGVEVMGQVGRQLTQIIEQVQALTPSFESVNDGMQSQSVGAQQISEALAQLNEAAQQTVESVRQSTAALDQLNGAARDLQSGVSRFTLAA
jgi:methyl-accepting chemotaxis protein WspA